MKSVETDGYVGVSPYSAAADLSAFQRASPNIPASTPDPWPVLANVLKDVDRKLALIGDRLQSVHKDEPVRREYSRRVFIVHGHDAVLKNELARLLEKLDFVPIILHEQPDRGQTIIEKLGREMKDVGFAFIILTPDDVGAVASDPGILRSRARQNVVFEHGLFAGSLSNSRVCAIRQGDVEIPSDLHGVVYKTIQTGHGIGSIALEVANELKAAGYIVDANRLLAL